MLTATDIAYLLDRPARRDERLPIIMQDAPQTSGQTNVQKITMRPATSQQSAQSHTALAAPAGPPQSAAYPAMPAALPQQPNLGGSPPAAVQAASVPSTDEVSASTAHSTSENSSSDDTIIAGKKGSSSGTIAVPSGQAAVPWPAVTGAPPGYPGKQADLVELVELAKVHVNERSHLCGHLRYTTYSRWPCAAPALQRFHGQAGTESR